MSRRIEPDQEHESILLGKLNDRTSYQREKKYLHFEGGVIDLFHEQNGRLLISEVKKSSRFEESARMQLLYYLHKLQECGIDAVGELRIPKEKKVIPVKLTPENKESLLEACEAIQAIVALEKAPKPVRCHYCRGCAYLEFCWS